MFDDIHMRLVSESASKEESYELRLARCAECIEELTRDGDRSEQ
jgi:hypothetical protein